MMYKPLRPITRRSWRKSRKRGPNSGVCIDCGLETGWRSVNDRCFRCEMEEVRDRQPFWVEREIMVSAGKPDF